MTGRPCRKQPAGLWPFGWSSDTSPSVAPTNDPCRALGKRPLGTLPGACHPIRDAQATAWPARQPLISLVSGLWPVDRRGRSPRGALGRSVPCSLTGASPISEHCNPGRAVIKGSLRPGPRSPHPVPALRFGLRLPGSSDLAVDARALCLGLSGLRANELSGTAVKSEDMRPQIHRRGGSESSVRQL